MKTMKSIQKQLTFNIPCNPRSLGNPRNPLQPHESLLYRVSMTPKPDLSQPSKFSQICPRCHQITTDQGFELPYLGTHATCVQNKGIWTARKKHMLANVCSQHKNQCVANDACSQRHTFDNNKQISAELSTPKIYTERQQF